MKPLSEYAAGHITAGVAWPANRQYDYGLPLHDDPAQLHLADDYGPNICPDCYGAGWMRSTVNIGQLHRCERCAQLPVQVENERLGTLWRLSGFTPHAADPPSFTNFKTHDEATRLMLAASVEFARTPKGWLTMHGAWGGGKSHLGEAVTRSLLGRRIACLYMRAPDLFSYLGAVDRNPEAFTDYEGRMYWVQRTTVLVIDEWNKEKNSETVVKLRTALMDFRYQRARANEGGATMLISNDPPERWLDPAISSRSLDARFALVEGTSVDYRRVARRPTARTEGTS